VRLSPHGFALMPQAALAAAPAEVARRALERTLLAVGGRPYPPRRPRLDRLLQELRAAGQRFAGRTLGGCRLLARGDRLLICREAGAIADSLEPEAGSWRLWDGRFAIGASGDLGGLAVRALGAAGWQQRAGLDPAVPARPTLSVPAVVGPSLPGVWLGERLLAVPTLGLMVPGEVGRFRISARFRPCHPLAGAPFAGGPSASDGARGEGACCVGPLLRAADSLC
jgi:tRNA(Ile)-lysidine synthase